MLDLSARSRRPTARGTEQRTCGSRGAATSSAPTASCRSHAGAEVHRPRAHHRGVQALADAGCDRDHAARADGQPLPLRARRGGDGGGRCPAAEGALVQGRAPTATRSRGQSVTTFADLLRRIHDEVPAIQRLRFVTSYPRDFGDDVLEVMRDHPRICRYLHVPVQSGSDRMLKMMNRGYTVGEYDEFIDRCRSRISPRSAARSCSPATSSWASRPRPTRTSSDRRTARSGRGTRTASSSSTAPPRHVAYDKIPDDVPDAVKRERNNRLLAVQAEIRASGLTCDGELV
jgi:tRNA-2-methylthio-N6-dimethylallyladenosine synthase